MSCKCTTVYWLGHGIIQIWLLFVALTGVACSKVLFEFSGSIKKIKLEMETDRKKQNMC